MRFYTPCLIAVAILFTACGQIQDLPAPELLSPIPETMTEAHRVAWDVMASSSILTLITLDEDGQPQARILDATAPDSARFDVWMGTNVNSAKVREIRANPRATIMYRIPDSQGYVTLRGRAEIVDDPALKENYWRPSWAPFYPDREAMFILIHFTPFDGEVVSFTHGLMGDPLTWAAPEFGF